MTAPRLLLAFSMLASLATGCLSDDELSPAPPSAAAQELRCVGCNWGPPVLNSQTIDGVEVDELSLDFLERDGVRLVDLSVLAAGGSLTPLIEVSVHEGLLRGLDAQGNGYHGAEFVGSSWTLSIRDGANPRAVTMTIDQLIDDGPRSRYVFSHLPTGGNTAVPNCELDPATGERSAVLFGDLHVDPVSGEMIASPGTLYMGCISGAVGQATMWGYNPWDHGRDAHQAATRAVRADYCGDGAPFTESGIDLQLSDPLGVQQFTDPSLPTEALWGPDGAACLLEPRVDALSYTSIVCADRVIPLCDDDADFGDYPSALLWSKRGEDSSAS